MRSDKLFLHSTVFSVRTNFFSEHYDHMRITGIGGPGAPHHFLLERVAESGLGLAALFLSHRLHTLMLFLSHSIVSMLFYFVTVPRTSERQHRRYFLAT